MTRALVDQLDIGRHVQAIEDHPHRSNLLPEARFAYREREFDVNVPSSPKRETSMRIETRPTRG